MTNTFTETVEYQCRQMLHAAKRLDERGYIMHVWGVNRDDPTAAPPYGTTTALMQALTKEWCAKHRRRCVIVHVWPNSMPPLEWDDLWRTGRVFDHPFRFVTNVPRTRRLRIIVAALELMSATTQGRGNPTMGTGMLLRTELSDRFEFAGEGRGALTAVIRVLEMPDHWALLTQ